MSVYDEDGRVSPNALSFHQVLDRDVMDVLRRMIREDGYHSYEQAVTDLLDLGAKSYKRKYGKARSK